MESSFLHPTIFRRIACTPLHRKKIPPRHCLKNGHPDTAIQLCDFNGRLPPINIYIWRTLKTDDQKNIFLKQDSIFVEDFFPFSWVEAVPESRDRDLKRDTA